MTIKFGLRVKKTGKVLGVRTSHNSGDFCVEDSHYLSDSEDNMWLVDDKFQAEYVRNFSTDWFNAGYDTPSNKFEPEELEVCSVEVITNVDKVEVSIPSVYELYEKRYTKTRKDKRHWEYLKKLIDGDSVTRYSLWDLKEYMES